MTVRDQILFGLFAVTGFALVLIKYKPVRFFGRRLSLNESVGVCWIAFSIYIGAVLGYYALKLLFGFPHATNGPATAIAACVSMLSILYLGRIQPDWERAVAKSLIGLFSYIVLVCAAILLR
ncbi:hypothetical protein [Bradyrhizobium sp. SYSU BS000235]|uniref:hypothetical protein n=1 Tax=Bradyrhizobium sp. SYSU BS000235 TaxID=3411332 RepID=UPI003C7499ED